jgi:uncharacterized protein
MIAIDTNVLVYLHRSDSSFHLPARKAFDELLATRLPWAITWPNLHEFLAIVTHPKIYKPPTPLPVAIEVVESWLEIPSLRLLAETGTHWPVLKSLLLAGQAAGPLIHDARIAALCLEHGVSELWSLDRDFSRFPTIRMVNPLIPN